MNVNEFFEPSLRGYAGYCVGFLIRYFLLAGGAVLFFHGVARQRWLHCRIQRSFPSRSEMLYEIGWSMSNTLCTGLSTMLLYQLIRDGRTSMYFAVADHGWPYFFVSIFLCIAGYDTWIYWQHRLLHTPWFFEHVHSVHHRITNPTPLATFAQHPIETFMGNAYFVLFVVFLPIHPLAFAAAGLYMFIFGIIGHLGYEFYPAGFTRHPIFQWVNTSTHHNMHHSMVGCNYGNWFNYWDRIMGTNHEAYHTTFEAIRARARVRFDPTPTVEEDENRVARHAA